MTDLPDINVRFTVQDTAAIRRMKELRFSLLGAKDATDELRDAQQRAAEAAISHNQKLQETARQARFLRGNIQNVSYQIQDFAVQVTNGTSVTTALGQQLPQLLGGFGMLGAAFGAAAAVLVPLVRYLSDAGDEVDDLAKALDDARAAVSEFSAAHKRTGEELVEQYGRQVFAVRELLEAQKELAEFEARREIMAASQEVVDNLASTKTLVDDMMQRSAEAIAESGESVYALLDAMDALRASKTPEDMADNMARLREELIAATAGLDDMEKFGVLPVYEAILKAEVAAAELASIDYETNLNAATTAAGSFADELARAATNAANAAAARQAFEDAGSPEGVLPGTTRGSADFAAEAFLDPLGALPPQMQPTQRRSRSSGGGAAAAKDPTIGALARSLMTETELVDNWRQESLAKLADFNALELAALGSHSEAKLRIEQEYQNRVGNLRREQHALTLGAASSFLTAYSDMQDSENRKQFENQKKARKAAAILDGAAAGVAAWHKGMELGGLPLATAYAATSAMRTAAMISQISGASFGGSATGGSAGRGGVSTAQAPLQVQLVGLEADQLYKGSTVIELLDVLQDAAGNIGMTLLTPR